MKNQKDLKKWKMLVTGKLAPVVLFVYDRPWHVEQTLLALQANELAQESELIIYADGAKKDANAEQIFNIEAVSKIIESNWGFKSITIHKRIENAGLANSIIEGVTEVVNQYGKVIVLEDDMLCSKAFLNFMNASLNDFTSDTEVYQISGYQYPIASDSTDTIRFKAKQMACWGWATWSDKWNKLNTNASELLNKIGESKEQIQRFNNSNYSDFYEQLKRNHTGALFTWAVKWHASIFVNDGYVVYPNHSFVKNIGFDNSGLHCGESFEFDSNIAPAVHNLHDAEGREIEVWREKQRAFFNKLISRDVVKLSSRIKNKFYSIWMDKALNISNLDTFFIKKEIIKSLIHSKAKLFAPYNLSNVRIDKYTYVAQGSQVKNTKIGAFCSIGPNLKCGWGVHPTGALSTSPLFYSKSNPFNLSPFFKDQNVVEEKGISIGNDVFIGRDVIVLDGISIKDGAVIAAGSVVTKDVEAYTTVGGVPAKKIKSRFEEVDKILIANMKWWYWPDAFLQEEYLKKHHFEISHLLNFGEE